MNPSCVLLIVLVSGTVACRKADTNPPRLTPVKVQAVEMLSGSDELRYSANVEADTQVNLAFKVGGYIERLHRVRGADGRERDVQEGDFVPAGTALARVRQADYEVKLNQAKAQLAEAEFSMDAGKAQLQQAEASCRQAQLDFTRAKNLLETQSLTRAEFDGAATKLEVARAALEAARSQVAAVEARRKAAEAMLAEAGIAFADTELKAPMTGVVLNRMVESGSLVGPGTTGFVLADTRVAKVTFGVPDTLVPSLRLATLVAIRAEALPNEAFSGRVTRIAPAADPRSRVFDVQVSVPNPHYRLRVGMIASVTLKSAPQSAAPAVPLTAVVRSLKVPNGYAVFVVRNEGGRSVAHLRDVALGRSSGNAIAATSGLAPGERIVTNGSNLIHDGDAVLVMP